MDADERDLVAALALLGLPRGADRADVSRAYRRLARDTHPDMSADGDAAARFDALARAYRLAVGATRGPDEPRPAEARPTRRTPAAPPPSPAPAHRWPAAPLDAWIIVGPVHVQPPPSARPTHPGR